MVDIVAAKPYLKAKEREEDEFLRSKKIKVVLKPIKIIKHRNSTGSNKVGHIVKKCATKLNEFQERY